MNYSSNIKENNTSVYISRPSKNQSNQSYTVERFQGKYFRGIHLSYQVNYIILDWELLEMFLYYESFILRKF